MEGQPGRLRVDLTLQRSNAEDGRKIISLSLRGQPRSHSADIRNDVLRHLVKRFGDVSCLFVSNQVAVGPSGGRFSSVRVV
jgi:hypothetical protein